MWSATTSIGAKLLQTVRSFLYSFTRKKIFSTLWFLPFYQLFFAQAKKRAKKKPKISLCCPIRDAFWNFFAENNYGKKEYQYGLERKSNNQRRKTFILKTNVNSPSTPLQPFLLTQFYLLASSSLSPQPFKKLQLFAFYWEKTSFNVFIDRFISLLKIVKYQ